MSDRTIISVKKGTSFSVKCENDKKDNGVTGIIALSSRDVVVSDYQNNALKLYDSEGKFVTSVENPQYTMGLTVLIGNDFATCGWDRMIYLWTVRDQNIIRLESEYEVKHDADDISFNGEYFVVLHRFDNIISILDDKGNPKNSIHIKEAFGKRINFGIGIEMDDHRTYIPCVEVSQEVLCLFLDGTPLWHTKCLGKTGGLTLIQDILCIVDVEAHCINMVHKDKGQYIDELLNAFDLKGEPSTICYGKTSDSIYITFGVWTDLKDNVKMFLLN